MSTFTNTIDTLRQPLNIPVSKHGYRLVTDFVYLWEHKSQQLRLTVPSGFDYDGASVPRICWTITGLRPDGLIRAAATAHGFLYRHSGNVPASNMQLALPALRGQHFHKWQEIKTPWSRKQADKLFARIMRESGVGKFQRRLAYLAVRAVGWTRWT